MYPSRMRTGLPGVSSAFWPVVAALCCCAVSAVGAGTTGGQNGTEPPTTTDSRGKSQGQGSSENFRAIDKGMEPLYLMTTTFLDLVQSKDKGFFFDKLKIQQDIIDGRYDVIIKSLSPNWEVWMQHYVGFAVCTIVGLVFILVMPLIGLCFCCCRCCGNCGAKSGRGEKGGDRCKRISCSIFLAIITTLMLAGMVCAFVTNELMRQQTSQDTGSLLNNVTQNLNSLEMYKLNTIKEFEDAVVGKLELTTHNIIVKLKKAPEEAKSNLSRITDAGNLLNKAMALAHSAQMINESLTQTDKLTESLQADGEQLQIELDTLKADILLHLTGCAQTACSDLISKVNTLDREANFANEFLSVVDSVDSQLDSIREVLRHNLDQLIQQGEDQFQDITDRVGTKVNDQIGEKMSEIIVEAETKITSIVAEVKQQVDESTRTLKESFDLQEVERSIDVYKPHVEQYGNYRYYGGIGFSCILLLVILFNYLGLSFGACGDAPGDDAPACNRGIGANILMVGVTFTFLFSWLLMLVTLILFLAGGISYTEVCRHATDLDNAPESVKESLNAIVNASLHSAQLNVELTTLISNCKENQPLYKALHLENSQSLSDALDLKRYGVKEALDRVAAQANVDLDNIEILSNATKRELERLRDSELQSINFDTFDAELAKKMTSPNLTTLATELDRTADALATAEPTTASLLRGDAIRLREIENSLVTKMLTEAAELKVAVTALEREISGTSAFNEVVQDLINALLQAQHNITTNGSRLLKQFVQDFADEIYQDLLRYTANLENKITTSIGQCRPVYQALQSTVDSFCLTLLNPFNGFWFSFGWCIFFFLPSLISSIALVSHYRRTDEYFDDKGFDDADLVGYPQRNYDAYTGVYPGDNIPLEELKSAAMERSARKKKYSPLGIARNKKNRGQSPSQGQGPSPGRSREGQGLHNTAYEREDYAPPSNTRHPGAAPHGGGSNHENGGDPRGAAQHGRDRAVYPPSTPTQSALNPPHYYNNRPNLY